MVSLSWEQVSAWRLRQHHLLERTEHSRWLEVVQHIGGLHAQLMSSAELALWARVQAVTSDDVQNALWRDRTLVKTWAMRGTLHLLPASDFPTYAAALSAFKHFRRGSWLKYHGVTIAELEAILDAVPATLNGVGMTREQLADALAVRTNTPKLRDLLLSGWGMLLKPTAFQGSLCFGPNQGQNVTFVQPRHWLGDWTPLDSQQALQTIVRRYLTAYGPSTSDEFSRWWGLEPANVKKLFKSLGDELVEVSVDGWKAWALASTLDTLNTLPAPRTIRLLPYFDPYTVAMSHQTHYLMAEEHKSRVYRAQGWIFPVVLADGKIVGIWDQKPKRAQTLVTIEPFAPFSTEIQQGVEAETQRLGTFLGTEIAVNYAQ